MVLLYALPTGIGLENQDLRFTAVMFLVPAIALFVASFLRTKVQSRIKSARKDYASVLILIAFMEIGLATWIGQIQSREFVLIAVGIFVFLYAFSKEGLPRLLYVVSVYRYFAKPSDYNRLLSLDYAVRVFGILVGTLIAALMLKSGDWRAALVYDSITFFILGGALLFFGIDEPALEPIESNSSQAVKSNIGLNLGRIAIIVPCLSAASCLFWPHISMLSQKFHVLDAWKSTTLIALLNFPALVLGLFLERITAVFAPKRMLLALPCFYALTGLLFLLSPSPLTLGLVIFANGLIQGLYWPIDYSQRNSLSNDQLVVFNSRVLRRFSVAQFASCLFVIIFATSVNLQFYLLGMLVLVFACSVLLLFRFVSHNKVPGYLTMC